MGTDSILLIILAVGTAVLNKEIIVAEWFSSLKKRQEQKS